MAEDLRERIENSEVYREYMVHSSAVGSDKILFSKIVELKKAQFDMQAKTMQNIPPSFDEEKYISKLYFDLMLNKNAKNYFDSEKQMIDLYKSIEDILDGVLKLDVGFE